MTLLIGGAGQDLPRRALALLPSGARLADGATCSLAEAEAADGLVNLHLLLRRLPNETVDALAERLTQSALSVIASAEVGCGVVPLDAAERDWRERCGRLCCLLAQHCDRVERLVCGQPILIKGEPSS